MPRLPSQATVCLGGMKIVHGVAKANKREMGMACEYCGVVPVDVLLLALLRHELTFFVISCALLGSATAGQQP
jgi:hypothetical protein